jgi:hypothetical protein
MKHTHYKLGDNCVVSDLTGFKYNGTEMVYGVDAESGMVMHKSEFSPHNPQFNLQPIQEKQVIPPKVRTEPPYVFVTNTTPEDL